MLLDELTKDDFRLLSFKEREYTYFFSAQKPLSKEDKVEIVSNLESILENSQQLLEIYQANQSYWHRFIPKRFKEFREFKYRDFLESRFIEPLRYLMESLVQTRENLGIFLHQSSHFTHYLPVTQSYNLPITSVSYKKIFKDPQVGAMAYSIKETFDSVENLTMEVHKNQLAQSPRKFESSCTANLYNNIIVLAENFEVLLRHSPHRPLHQAPIEPRALPPHGRYASLKIPPAGVIQH